METIKLGNKMIEIPIKHNPDNKEWVLCACPECEGEFIVKLKVSEGKTELWEFKPDLRKLTCPYCGIKSDIYAEHSPKVEL